MTTAAAVRYGLNIHHPDIMRGIVERVLGTGDVLGHDSSGRVVLAVAVEPWLFDALAARTWRTASRSPMRTTAYDRAGPALRGPGALPEQRHARAAYRGLQ